MKKISPTGLKTKALECEVHGTYESNVITIGGQERPGRCPMCVHIEQLVQARRTKGDRERKLLARAELPPRYRTRTFDNYRPVNAKAARVLRACRDYAEGFEGRRRQGGGIIMCGAPGTGKTHLAAAIARVVIERHGRSVWYTTVAAAVRYVKQTYSADAIVSESAAIKRFQVPELLILDEVGMQRGTEYEVTLLAEVLNERYANVLPTVLITNYTHEKLATFIGARAIDRMREGGGVVLAFDWESYRAKVERDDDLTWPDLVPA